MSKSNKIQLIGLLVGGVAAFGFLIFSICFFLLRVTPRSSEFTIELGDELSLEPTYYLTGISFVHKGSYISKNNVDNMVVGDYQLEISRNDKLYDFVIHVVDTTAPVFETKTKTIELGYEYLADEFVKSLVEKSDNYAIYIRDDFGRVVAQNGHNVSADTEYLQLVIKGDYTFSVEIVDACGNASEGELKVSVEDTVPPDITIISELPYFAIGREYGIDAFVESTVDLSGTSFAAFKQDGEFVDTIIVNEMGTQNIAVFAYDESGNETSVNVSAVFDEAPIFIGLRDLTLKVNSNYDFSTFPLAVDLVDGDLTSDINVDLSELDLTEKGQYTVTYSVVDSYNLESVETILVTVDNNDDTKVELSDEDIVTLVDYGYFVSYALEEKDTEMAEELVKPSLVNLIYRYGNGGYCAGSGFIYKIDSDFMYIASCVHVMAGLKGTIDMMFCDANATEISFEPPHYLELSDEMEMAMFRIPTSDVPSEVLVELKQVCYDEDVYDFLAEGDTVIAYSGHWKNGSKLIKVLKVIDTYSYFDTDARYCVHTTAGVVGGMSGTALVDEYGRLVGMTEGKIGKLVGDSYSYTDYFLRIDDIDELYHRLLSGE